MEYKEPDRQFATIFVVVVTALITTFSSSAVTLAIPSIGLEFASSATLLGWIVTGYMLCVAMFAVPFGRLADLTGRQRVFIIGVIGFTIFNGLTFFAWNLETVVLLRVMQGMAAAMIFSTSNAILINAFPADKRGKVLGYAITSTYFGLAAGPPIGGLISHYLGWRYIFLFSLVIGLLAMVVSITRLPKNNADHEEKTKGAFNLTGNILYIVMVFCIMYGFSLFSESYLAKVLIVAGVIIGGFFVSHELKTEKPIIKMSLFKGNSSFLLSNIAALFNYGATFAVGYLMSLYLQLIMGYTSEIAGLILIVQPLVMTLISPWAGRASDKVSPFKLASAGMALCALTLFSYRFIGAESSLIYIIVNLAVIGIGFGLFSSPNTNAVMSCVPKADYGVASSILTTMRSLGHTSSMAILTLIMGAHLGGQTLAQTTPQQLIDTLRTCFTVFAVICAAGVFISLQRKTKNLERDKRS